MRRRDFLRAPLLLGLTNNQFISSVYAVSNSTPTTDEKNSFSYIASAKSRLGEASFICLNSDGEQVNQLNIPSRGHSFARSVGGHVAAIARRPADFCLILDRYGNSVTEFKAAPSRHFYGHGVYDAKGEYLYLTENDFGFQRPDSQRPGFQSSRGVIGIYSVADNYQRIGEFESGGIGPHQIMLSKDASELIVANGGIQTHPESGRKKLNLKSMRPSLAFINRETGVLRQSLELEPEYSTNSIRHMAQHSSGRIYLALQQQVSEEQTCLLAVYDPSKNGLSKLPLSKSNETMLNKYVGDIALDSSEQYLAATSPYGNVVLVMDLSEGSVYSLALDDVCGLNKSIKSGLFVVTTGQGKMLELSVSNNEINQNSLADTRQRLLWDNHLLSLI